MILEVGGGGGGGGGAEVCPTLCGLLSLTLLALCCALQDVCESSKAAKELFTNASDILGYDLLEMCTEGEARLHSLSHFRCLVGHGKPLPIAREQY